MKPYPPINPGTPSAFAKSQGFGFCRWHIGVMFTDCHGRCVACWQLIRDDGAIYELSLSDGLPCKELTLADWTDHQIRSVRDECTAMERARLGI